MNILVWTLYFYIWLQAWSFLIHLSNKTQLLEQIEKAVTLLIFENPNQSPLSDLLDSTKKLKTASDLNSILLKSQNQEKDPKIPHLLKLLKFSQNKLGAQLSFPEIKDFKNITFSLESKNDNDE